MSRRVLLSLLVPALVACDDAGPTAVRTRDPATPAPLPVARYLSVTPSKARLNTGDELRLDVIAQDAQRRAMAAAHVTWRSADTTIATVANNGFVRAVTPGYVQILAASGGTSAFSLLQIGVNGEYPAGVVLEPATATLSMCDRLAFRARTNPDINDTRFRWTSSDTTVLRVDDAGMVRGVAPGVARIDIVWLPDPSRAVFRDVTVVACGG